ncbi:hypothetical protein B0H17DRAFT_1152026 [Mycena rosella]|uniref:Uncharacterized protein n=1 Tax=Mycena rosella TaxID=1033263 RepID=A0AAD7BGW5_MYCRO|nr:hypothetical protein B0H17DRAFT_1152026 [Mycena rosella]
MRTDWPGLAVGLVLLVLLLWQSAVPGFPPPPRMATRVGSGSVESDFEFAPHHHEEHDHHPHPDHHHPPLPPGLLHWITAPAPARGPARLARSLLPRQNGTGIFAAARRHRYARAIARPALFCARGVFWVQCSWRWRVPALWLLAPHLSNSRPSHPASGMLTTMLRGVDSCVQPHAAGYGADALGSYHEATWTGVAFGGLKVDATRQLELEVDPR